MRGDIYIAKIPGTESWKVGIDGVFDTQGQAEEMGRAIAERLRVELVIHRPDGSIRDKDSHGHDPEDIPG